MLSFDYYNDVLAELKQDLADYVITCMYVKDQIYFLFSNEFDYVVISVNDSDCFRSNTPISSVVERIKREFNEKMIAPSDSILEFKDKLFLRSLQDESIDDALYLESNHKRLYCFIMDDEIVGLQYAKNFTETEQQQMLLWARENTMKSFTLNKSILNDTLIFYEAFPQAACFIDDILDFISDEIKMSFFVALIGDTALIINEQHAKTFSINSVHDKLFYFDFNTKKLCEVVCNADNE